MSVEDVAEKLNKLPADVSNWESGADAPTYVQLEKLAYEVYKRPIALFFLPEPPKEHRPQSEFRTLPIFDLENLASDTFLHIRKAHAYQIALHELFGGRNPAERKLWKSSPLDLAKPIQVAALSIRRALGITSEAQASWGDESDALRHWRQAIEQSGVFVFKNSFKQREISGFCLRDDEFPLIYLNNSTTKERLNKLSLNSHPDVRRACMAITGEKSRRPGLHAAVHGAFEAMSGRFPRSWTHVSCSGQQNAPRHPQIR